MSDSKQSFTPGPWFDWDLGVWIYDPNRLLTNREDARLIAAAPDLYSTGRKLAAEVGALKAFEADVRAVIGNTNWSILMQRLDECDAAIAKAGG